MEKTVNINAEQARRELPLMIAVLDDKQIQAAISCLAQALPELYDRLLQPRHQ